MERRQDREHPNIVQADAAFPSTAASGVTGHQFPGADPGFFGLLPPTTAYPAVCAPPSAGSASHSVSAGPSFLEASGRLRAGSSPRQDPSRPGCPQDAHTFARSGSAPSGERHEGAFLQSARTAALLSPTPPSGTQSSDSSQCLPVPTAGSQKSSPFASTASTPPQASQSHAHFSSYVSLPPGAAKDVPGRGQPNRFDQSLGDSFCVERFVAPDQPSYQSMRDQPRLGCHAARPSHSASSSQLSSGDPQREVSQGAGLDCRTGQGDGRAEARPEGVWNFGSRGSLSFEDLIAQVHKLLRSNTNSSSSSSASTPRRQPSGRLTEPSETSWESKSKDHRSIWARESTADGATLEQQPQAGLLSGKTGKDLYGIERVGQLDFAVLQEGGLQCAASSLDSQALAVLQELNRVAVQQRVWESQMEAVTQENAALQSRVAMLEERQRILQQQNQALRAAQQSRVERGAFGVGGCARGTGRGALQRSGSSRLLAPSGYQGPDQIQSAPNPSTPIIKGSDKISVEQFLLSFPFTATQDYPHAMLKFCADHNLVVKLLGYHGKRVELLERQYCCRIQTSAQASSFPGYPNGRCVLFTGPLTCLLRACADLYAVVDTSSPGLRTNIEGYRVCLVVPGDFVGRLLRSNCAGLHALQEAGGKIVHIALGNLCVVMRGNYSERVLLIDGNIEGVCQVLESASTQLQDFLRRFSGQGGACGTGGSTSLTSRYEFLDYPKRIELHLSS
ncbi:kh domain containing [Cystoisospora suis]|uniref:Kh domain containing n=1 Tax=Cystoisospora suis TaxID=483139 RepID=A0A2C6LBZ7_9APIC|nr:kh domain containing [Cystoisospora suis]